MKFTQCEWCKKPGVCLELKTGKFVCLYCQREVAKKERAKK
jgi:uncharacterized Zn finger protein (UPF0148 family)